MCAGTHTYTHINELSDVYVCVKSLCMHSYYFIRWSNFEITWKMLFEVRWPSLGTTYFSGNCLSKTNGGEDVWTDDWHQMYWERHLQKYGYLTETSL